jgi:hypothetical protein
VLHPFVEGCVAVILVVDASPLRRREFILESLVYTAAILSIPWLGWRLGCMLSRSALGLVSMLVLFEKGHLLTNIAVSVAVLFMAFGRVDGGMSVESISGAWLAVMFVLCWSEFSPLEENRFVKWIRALIVSEACKWSLVESGLIFAFQVKDDREVTLTEAQELEEVDEEFSRVPQHLICIITLIVVSLHYLVLDTPVTLLAAIIVVLHFMVFMIDPPSGRWFVLRVSYLDGLSFTTHFVKAGNHLAHYFDRRYPARVSFDRLVSLCAVMCVLVACGLAALLLWATPYPAQLFSIINFGMIGWIVPAALSQKLFSGAFSFICAISLMLMFACAGVFSIEDAELSRWPSVLCTTPLLVACSALWRSNAQLFCRPEQKASPARKRPDTSAMRRPQPRRKR